MYFMARPKAPAKSMRAAPFTACPIRLNILVPLAGVRVDALRVAFGFQFHRLALGRAGGLEVAQGVQRGDAAARSAAAGASRQRQRREEDRRRPDHAAGPNTRQAETSTTATSEVGRKTFQPSR